MHRPVGHSSGMSARTQGWTRPLCLARLVYTAQLCGASSSHEQCTCRLHCLDPPPLVTCSRVPVQVRNSAGGIVQLAYGEDNLDPVAMEDAGGRPIDLPRSLSVVHATMPQQPRVPDNAADEGAAALHLARQHRPALLSILGIITLPSLTRQKVLKGLP